MGAHTVNAVGRAQGLRAVKHQIQTKLFAGLFRGAQGLVQYRPKLLAAAMGDGRVWDHQVVRFQSQTGPDRLELPVPLAGLELVDFGGDDME